MILTRRDSPLEKIAQQVICPICMEIYRHPKALSCLHTYCKECVQSLVHRRSTDQEIVCPQCRADIPVTGNNVENLPTVFFINELIDIYNAMKQASDNVEIACQNCSEGKAVAFCQSCDEKGLFICAKCEGAHKQMKVFADHKVVSLTELKQGSLIHLPSKKTPTYSCSKHNGELKKLYCFTCSQLICRDCTLVDHPKDSGHKYDFVNSVASAFKSELNVKVLPIQDANAALAQALSQLEASKKSITEQSESIKQRISSSFNELLALLEEHKKLLLKQTGEAVEWTMNTIERQQNDLKTAKNECESVLNFVKLTSDSACDEEIVAVKENIETRLQELADKTKHIQLQVMVPTEMAKLNTDMILATPSKCQIKKLVKNQGFIAFIDGSDTGATTGKASIFKFRLIDAHSQPSVGTLTITTELKSLAGHHLIVPTKVSSKIPSVYEVSYTPQRRGRHQLIIRINTIEMATFPIFVNRPPTSLDTPIGMIKSEAAWRIALSKKGDIYLTQYTLEQFVCLNCGGSVKQVVKCADIVAARGIEVDSQTGSVYISGNHKLQKYNSDGQLIKEVGGTDHGNRPGELHEPNDIRFYKSRVYICDSGNGRVQIFDPELNYIHSFGTKGKEIGQLQWPEDIDFDTDGNAYIVDSQEQCVSVFSPTYQFLKCIGKGSTSLGILPLSIRIHGNYMYISDPHKGVSIYHKSTGKRIHCLTKSTVDYDGQMKVFPVGLAIDMDGYVYVCQHKSNGVLIY